MYPMPSISSRALESAQGEKLDADSWDNDAQDSVLTQIFVNVFVEEEGRGAAGGVSSGAT
jgi:hypothetical protein